MLWFERRVVATLVETLDEPRQEAVAACVDGALGAMPEHLRFGVAAESVLLGGWAKLQRAAGRPDDQVLGAQLEGLESHPVGVVRQYVRLLRSLVLFAQYELVTEAAP